MLVSYAQNFEDVILWRALRNVGRGFYIDVGAADPDSNNVTKAFSDRGWTGINIEPTARHFERLQRSRPRDVNIQAVAASKSGEATFYQIDLGGTISTDLSTMSEAVARRHAAEGHPSSALRVPAITLTEICDAHSRGPIHFLKIDVEGAERDVLLGIDLSRHRPWIITVEAVEPGGGLPTHPEWEGLLLRADYRFAYFDGLNRFYVAAEHGELAAAIAVPPNVFDRFIRAGEIAAHERAQRAENAAAVAAQERDAAYQSLLALAEARRPSQKIRRALARVKQRGLRPLLQRLGLSAKP
jgi:FkbM family methyltransferase